MKKNEYNSIYMPERLFVCNLFNYCNISKEKLGLRINDLIQNDIGIKIEEIEMEINNPGNKCNQFFTTSFTKFVKEQEFLKREKAPNYCLLTCYDELMHAVLSSKSNKRRASDYEDIEQNRNLLKEYEEYIKALTFRDYAVISTRELQRLLEPCGGPYKSTQVKFISYLVKRVFPTLIIEENLLSLVCDNWKNVIFYSGTPLVQKIYIQANEDSAENVEEKLQNKFKEISKVPNADYEEVGRLFLEIFYYVKDQYHNGNLSFYQDVNNTITPKDQQGKTNTDNSYYYDSMLSSHIIWFMRWLPIISEDYDSETLLITVSNIIESIRDSLFSSHNKEVAIKSLNRHPSENLFIYENPTLKVNHGENLSKSKEFRTLLFKALHDEPSVRLMVDDTYKTI